MYTGSTWFFLLRYIIKIVSFAHLSAPPPSFFSLFCLIPCVYLLTKRKAQCGSFQHRVFFLKGKHLHRWLKGKKRQNFNQAVVYQNKLAITLQKSYLENEDISSPGMREARTRVTVSEGNRCKSCFSLFL